jgi:pimeloyl-ACP methyl ester carboxylesterase
MGRQATFDASMNASHAAPVTWKNVPTRTIIAGGVTFSYRELGVDNPGPPVVFLIHLAAVLDNWGPRIVDGIAAKHRVITFDNRGVGASSGSPATSMEEMARDATTFIRAMIRTGKEVLARLKERSSDGR